MRGALRVSAIVVSIAGSAAVGCRQLFGIHEAQLVDADLVDAEFVPDAGPCQALDATCASADTLRTCTVLGEQPTDQTCVWSCIDAPGMTPHCAKIVPSGGGVLPTDVDPDVMLGDVVINGVVDPIGGAISGTTSRPPGIGLKAGIDFEMRGGIAIFRAKSIMFGTVSFGNAAGRPPVAFVADGAIIVAGPIGLVGDCTTTTGGPGAFAGGATTTAAAGSGGGQGASDNNKSPGGGGYGGNGGNGVNGPMGGATFGDARVSVLVGGGGGGGGADQTNGGVGGGGGGAIQLVSNAALQVTTTGSINAGGCGGGGGNGNNSGGGGGAGGTILLEAPAITIAGVLAVNGGGGGGGYDGTAGTAGTATRIQAAGGMKGAGPGGDGGSGAAANVLDGVDAALANHPGGGGGAIGRIRFDTKTGATTITGTLSPALTDVPTTCTAAPAAVQ